ncbi:MAG: acyl-CoA dehydratase activase [Thermodesulfobacteriota bacterium]
MSANLAALGIDVGSTTVKIVAVDSDGVILWHYIEPAAPRVDRQVNDFLEMVSRKFGNVSDIPLVATGYGRKLVPMASKQTTEITCHARGVYKQLRHSGTLVDIGGQDSKVIIISSSGQVEDFTMNDKCAAGTGRFLENTAGRLHVDVDKMGTVALSVQEEAHISSTCTVFAESEIISKIANGVAVEAILKGLHRSLIFRIVAMIRSLGLIPPLILSGGVVKNPAIRYMLSEETGESVILPELPQLMGAYGAALIALG